MELRKQWTLEEEAAREITKKGKNWEFLSFLKDPKAHKSVQHVRELPAFTAGKTVNVDKWALFSVP